MVTWMNFYFVTVLFFQALLKYDWQITVYLGCDFFKVYIMISYT